MKKLIIIIGLIGCTVANSFAQGTIAWGASAMTRVYIEELNGMRRFATPADGIKVGVFYGPAGSTQDQFVMAPGIATIGTTPGVLVGVGSVFALPGTEPNQTVSLQLRGWNDLGGYGETGVKQVTLGQTAGPGAVIWQPVGSPDLRILVIRMVPEPSTITISISMIGVLFAFLRFRKSSNR